MSHQCLRRRMKAFHSICNWLQSFRAELLSRWPACFQSESFLYQRLPAVQAKLIYTSLCQIPQPLATQIKCYLHRRRTEALQPSWPGRLGRIGRVEMTPRDDNLTKQVDPKNLLPSRQPVLPISKGLDLPPWIFRVFWATPRMAHAPHFFLDSTSWGRYRASRHTANRVPEHSLSKQLGHF